ncbi:MAG: 4Fe-4S binding protein [Treponema sp.]|jgi:polyferredoxin|nr:4Fe-4S binding protein [Treponema sp.]
MNNLTNKNSNIIAKYLRWIILGFILGGSMLIHFLHLFAGQRFPSVHAICPLGGLENLWTWIAGAGRGNIQKITSGTMTLFFFTLVLALIFGRAFCGNICPFGTLQELFGKFSKKKIQLSGKIDNAARFFKYLVLIFVTIMAWITATLWISPYDPWGAFAHIWRGKELFHEYAAGFIILLIVLAASVFINRFSCKYLCPAGAVYGIISKISPARIKRNDCSQCGQCSAVCPMNIDVARIKTVKSAECIVCNQCTISCKSKTNDIQITFFNKSIKPLAFIIIIVTVFFGSLFIFNKTGILRVTVPALESVLESGNFLRIIDIRGSMSIEAASEYVGMELSEFYNLMEIPKTVPKETWLRDVSLHVPGYDFHVIRDSR